MRIQESPKPLSLLFSLLVALCFAYTVSLVLSGKYWMLMFMGMSRLPGGWQYASVQNLWSLPGQHFEKGKANMLGKLQRYFLSVIYPTPCLNQEAFCTIALLSVLMVSAELASFKQYLSPSLAAPFCHATAVVCVGHGL